MQSEPTGQPAAPPVQAAAASHVGLVRQSNEDSYLIDLERGLFIVSDGMGGHQAGGIASKLVVTILPQLIERKLASISSPQAQDFECILREAIFELSQRLHAESKGQVGLHGMGATVALAWFRSEQRAVHLAHMGDSRIYLFRRNHLAQLTEDHSVVALLLKHKDITPQEAQRHPARGRLSRFVGMEGEVYPDVQTVNLQVGDRLLLCTDGLTSLVPDEHIAALLRANSDPQVTCRALVEVANAAGGTDNITVLVVNWDTVEAADE